MVKKRIFLSSMVIASLVLGFLLGLVPPAKPVYAADDKITEVSITINEPKAGHLASTEFTLPNGANYNTNNTQIDWYEQAGGAWKRMEEGHVVQGKQIVRYSKETFKAGNKYKVQIKLFRNSNYSWDNSVTHKINGKDADRITLGEIV